MSVIKDVIAKVKQTDPNQPEFHQAVEEVMETLEPTVKKHPEYVKANIYERIVEPERAMQFRVPWVDDKGKVRSTEDSVFSSITPSDHTKADCVFILQ